ncbi:MAG TPA: M20 family metallopeptidase [Rectinemataceae bacterium]|nr:M20 family metallopeptidase [Rectinemataceae bacterium]
MATGKELLETTKMMKDWLVRTRRTLHRVPEAGDAEFRTQETVCGILDELGIPYTKKRTSVLALVEGSIPGKVVGLRADMDALPLNEPADRPYASRNKGYMHACGHDAHMTIALGAAKYFMEHRDSLEGSVKFLFQPAEETTGGAATMIAEGCLENPHVDFVTGLHVMPDVPVGKVELKHGALNGSSDFLGLTIRGKSAHAAYPSAGIDAIMIASKVVDALHSVVSRYVSPLQEAVLTIGTIQGGSRNNIIADEVRMTGTIRTTNPQVRAEIAGRVRAIVEGIPAAFGGSGEAEILAGYAALINHDWVVDLIAEEARAMLGADSIIWRDKASMGVEDFSFFVQERPGSFYHLGCGNPAAGIVSPLHSNTFDIDEDCLPIGVAMQAAVVVALLGKRS